MVLFDAAQDLDAVDAWHSQVQHHDVRLFLLHRLERLLPVGGDLRLHISQLQALGEAFGELLFVIHQKDFQFLFFHVSYLLRSARQPL